MNYYIFIYFFALMCFCLLLFLSQIAYYEKIDHEAFIEFVKGPVEFDKFFAQKGVENEQIKGIVSQIYGIHLGILYYLTKIWDCSKAKNVERWSRENKCEKYKKELKILYKHFFNVYVLNIKVKPSYGYYLYGRKIIYSNYIPICKFVQQFVSIFNFFFCNIKTNNADRQKKKFPVEEFFFSYKLEYDNMIATVEEQWKKLYNQKEYKAKEAKFEKIMEKMLEKVKKKAQLEKDRKTEDDKMAMDNSSTCAEDAVPLFDFLSKLPQYSVDDAIEDEAFVEFVKGGMNEKTKFMDIFVHFLFNAKNLVQQQKKLNIKEFEMHLGLLYLIKKNWHFAHEKAQIDAEFNKFGHYMDILYEYICRVRYGIAAVRPMFYTNDHLKKLTWIESLLNKKISQHCFGTYKSGLPELTLVNENELNFKESAANDSYFEYTFQEIVIQSALDASASAGKQINVTSFEGLFRHIFDQELAQLLGKWTKLASEAKAKLEALRGHRDYRYKKSNYEDSFSTLLDSPFF